MQSRLAPCFLAMPDPIQPRSTSPALTAVTISWLPPYGISLALAPALTNCFRALVQRTYWPFLV